MNKRQKKKAEKKRDDFSKYEDLMAGMTRFSEAMAEAMRGLAPVLEAFQNAILKVIRILLYRELYKSLVELKKQREEK